MNSIDSNVIITPYLNHTSKSISELSQMFIHLQINLHPRISLCLSSDYSLITYLHIFVYTLYIYIIPSINLS